jgi:hypothetical protein
MSTSPSGLAKSSGHRETCKKQVAMIAQKVMDANQTQDQGRWLIAPSDARAATLWTLLRDHQLLVSV